MNKKIRAFFRNLFLCLLALSIPGLLVLNGIQSSKYRTLKKEVEDLERKQESLIEENKKLITDISLLSSSDRIEKLLKKTWACVRQKVKKLFVSEFPSQRKIKNDRNR